MSELDISKLESYVREFDSFNKENDKRNIQVQGTGDKYAVQADILLDLDMNASEWNLIANYITNFNIKL